MNAGTKITPRLSKWLASEHAKRAHAPELFSPPKPAEPHDPMFFLSLAGVLACGGVGVGFILGGIIGAPEGPSVGAGFVLAILGPFFALGWGIIDERKRMRSGPPGEAFPPGVIGKSADGLYVYAEGAFEAQGR